MMRAFLTFASILLLAGLPASLTAQDAAKATAELMGRDGRHLGRVDLTQTPSNGVLLDVQVEGLEPGIHAIHIHQTGACEAPGFTSAGGHYAPGGHAHGLMDPAGKHAGDLVNFHVPSSGSAHIERLARDVSLESGAAGTLFDTNGSAVVIHAGADDYTSQPSGAAGDRVACGVIRR